MKCPACSKELSELTIQGVKIDACNNGCGGLWFDQLELRKFDEPHEIAGDELIDQLENTNTIVDQQARRKCPKCDDMIMMRHFFSVKKQVAVDECPACASFWLDLGELKKIRSMFKTEKERYEAADSYFNSIYSNELNSMKNESEEKLAKAKRLSQILKFICPSYYIDGKQDWGAF